MNSCYLSNSALTFSSLYTNHQDYARVLSDACVTVCKMKDSAIENRKVPISELAQGTAFAELNFAIGAVKCQI